MQLRGAKYWLVVGALSTAVALVAPLVANALTLSLPVAGTAKQISSLVASSTSINVLPARLVPPLAQLPLDTATNSALRAPAVCKIVAKSCTFGRANSSKLVVLFGDSHAWMWVNAVSPLMFKLGYRLQLLAYPGCPVAKVSIWASPILSMFTACDRWRAATIRTITKESPALVLLSERTSQLFKSATTLISAKQLSAGLSETIGSLQTSRTKVAVIGDIPTFTDLASPVSCLAINAAAVQKCSTALRNSHPAWRSLASAEKVATLSRSATFIDPTAWMCTHSHCSEIVGTMAVYFNGSHVSATYAAFVSGVMGAKIRPILTGTHL